MARKTKMKNITNPELLSQVNPQNAELLSDFLEELKVQNNGSNLNKYISIFYNDWSLNPYDEDDYSERVDIITIKLKDIKPKDYKAYTVMWWDKSRFLTNFVEICVKRIL